MAKQAVAVGDTGVVFTNTINSNFTELYSSSINAKHYGFLTTNTGAQNRLALQNAVDGGNKTVYIDSGVYDINDTILLDSNTTLKFAEGATLHKVTGSGTSFTQVLLNRGALTKTYNYNITIDGLTITGGSVGTFSTTIVGLSGQLGFYYIENLTVKNFTCTDGGSALFMISLCKWKHVYFENIKITSLKDAFSIQTGNDFTICNAVLETRDDAIGLKTCDYPNHETEAGDISNIFISNVTDSNYTSQTVTGYTVRVLLASWTDWASGNAYWRGDHCLNAGNLYISELGLAASGVGATPPTHTAGIVTGADGIPWRFLSVSSSKKTTVSNVNIDHCKFIKGRATVFVESWGGSTPGDFRAIYPGTEGTSFLETLSLTNNYFKFLPDVFSYAVRSTGGIKNIVYNSNVFKTVNGIYNTLSSANYPAYASTTYITFNGNHIDVMPYFIYATRNSESIIFNGSGNISPVAYYAYCYLSLGATLRFVDFDITLNSTMKPLLSPLVGDVVRDVAGRWIRKAGGWVNISI